MQNQFDPRPTPGTSGATATVSRAPRRRGTSASVLHAVSVYNYMASGIL